MSSWQFYVYALVLDGVPVYVGKGSGRRLSAQKRNFGLPGYEVARFRSETDAYRFEREVIAEWEPAFNKHPGGNGGTVRKRRRARLSSFAKELLAVGSRVWTARYLLSNDLRGYLLPEQVERLRLVADGHTARLRSGT